jgi:hypothetical protein
VPAPDFDAQIAALYVEPCALPDDAAFLARVEASIDERLQRRRWVLVSLGVMGAAITLLVCARLEASASLRDIFFLISRGITEAFANPWGGVAILLVALLVLPAFMRAAIDPK